MGSFGPQGGWFKCTKEHIKNFICGFTCMQAFRQLLIMKKCLDPRSWEFLGLTRSLKFDEGL